MSALQNIKESEWSLIEGAPENVVLLTKTDHFRSAHEYQIKMIKKDSDWFMVTEIGNLKSLYTPTHYKL